jgi:hypothetical protein
MGGGVIRGVGYEVFGTILLHAYLYIYMLLRAVTFEVIRLSTYALSPTMLPLMETFLELLLWISFQCHRHFWGGGISSIS